jgi:hypothetical protein
MRYATCRIARLYLPRQTIRRLNHRIKQGDFITLYMDEYSLIIEHISKYVQLSDEEIKRLIPFLN